MNEDGFLEFWTAFPRKEARKDALKAWMSLTAEQQFAAGHALPIHVRFWAAAGRTKQYIPLAASWIRGERWADELEMPAPKDEMGEWWKTTSGIQRKALSLGMQARAGEDWHQLKARILAKEKAA